MCYNELIMTKEEPKKPEETEEKKGLLAEFKEFINRGSVMDLAVGVVVGGAFTSIVNSLVSDIITPAIGLILGGIDFTDLSVTVGSATLTYGNFIQNVINFLLTAFAVFIFIKFLNKLQKDSGSLAKKTAAFNRDLLEKAKSSRSKK